MRLTLFGYMPRPFSIPNGSLKAKYVLHKICLDTAISIKVVPRAKWKSRIRARKAAGNR